MSNELLAYLDSLKPCYPNGIALSMARPAVPVSAESKHTIKILLVTSCSATRQAEIAELLANVVTKGLRFELRHSRIILDGVVAGEVLNAAAKVVYLTGQKTQRNFGSPVRQNGQAVLHTHLAESALDSAEVKRELWNHLKQLLTI